MASHDHPPDRGGSMDADPRRHVAPLMRGGRDTSGRLSADEDDRSASLTPLSFGQPPLYVISLANAVTTARAAADQIPVVRSFSTYFGTTSVAGP